MKNFNDLRNVEAERYVVCFALKSEENASYVTGKIEEEDFVDKGWEIAYKTIYRYFKKYETVSRQVVEDVLSKRIEKSEDYINQIEDNIHFVDNKSYEIYSSELKSLTQLRNVYNNAQKIQAKCLDEKIEYATILSDVQGFGKNLFSENENTARKPSEILSEDEEFELLLTNVDKFDKVLYPRGGRNLGGTNLIFSRPGHGKTYYVFMMSSLFQAQGYRGVHFSLEDTPMEMAKRASNQIYTKNDTSLIDNLLIDTEKRWLHDIVQSIRYYKYHYDISFVNVDHLGRVKVKGIPLDNKNASQIEVSNTLTDLCNDLNILGQFPVQPNKADKRKRGWDNLLTEDDLKGATEIFEDAFVVTTLFRPNQYRELRVEDGLNVKLWNYGAKHTDNQNTVAHYDSVFATKIKDRRSRLENNFVHFVQDGDYRIVLKSDLSNEYHKAKTMDVNDKELPF